MPTIKPTRATVKEIYQGFGGIGNSTKKGRLACRELQNFRILADGTLEKRCGFRKLYGLSDRIRAFWEGILDGEPLCFALVGNTVYRKNGEFFTQCNYVSTSSGTAEFVSYHETLYLFDGKTVYRFRPSALIFAVAEGYAPLIGMSWNPTQPGEQYEPINLFSKRFRISYSNTVGSTTYRLPYYVESIDSITADGQRVSDFVLGSDKRSFTVSRVYSWLEIGATMASEGEDAARIKTATHVFSDRINGIERLFLYGCASGNYLYGTAKINDFMLSSCRAHYPNADPLYIPADMQLAIGSEREPLTTLYKNHDRLLGFHAKGGVSIQIGKDTDVIDSYPVLYGYGCNAPLPTISVNGQMVIVNRAGIFLLSSKSSDPDEFELTLISDGIDAFREESFIQNATVCHDAAHEELWVYDRENALTIWVYHLRQKVWYTFTGLSPDIILHHEGNLAFVRNAAVYEFDESASTDDGRSIFAKLKSDFLFFDVPETAKRSLRVTLLTQNASDPINFCLESERQSKEWEIPKTNGNLPCLFDARASLGRFRILQAEISTTGNDRPRIFRLALFANS